MQFHLEVLLQFWVNIDFPKVIYLRGISNESKTELECLLTAVLMEWEFSINATL